MKYLIVGLGNPGAEYSNTRHNIGFQILDTFAKQENLSFVDDRLGAVCEWRHKGRIFTFLKPSTYMNLSGKAIKYWMEKKGVEKDNVLVVLDDLSIDFGKLRIKAKGSDGGHNGLKHIQETLGTVEYPRMRFGIGSDFAKGRQVEFVLGNWTADEQAKMPEIVNKACAAIKNFGLAGLQHTMNHFNG